MFVFDSCAGVGSGAVRRRLRLPVCVVCVVAERSFCGAFGMHEISLHDVNGGGVLVYSRPLRV